MKERSSRIGPWVLFAFLACALACETEGDSGTVAGDPLATLPSEGMAPEVLQVGVTPGAGAEAMAHRVDPLGNYLQTHLDHRVQLRVARNQDELRSWLARGEVHVALFSPLAWVEHRDRLPAVPIASATRRGAPTYLGYLVVADAARFSDLRKLRGAHVAWVGRSSTSGYLYPRLLLRWRGLDPDGFFGRQSFGGDHLEVIRSVAAGRVDVGAVASSFVDPGPGLRIPEADGVTVIAKTERIPLDCVAVRDDLDRHLASALRQSLLAMDDAQASRELRRSWGIDGFAPLEPWRYDAVEQALARERSD